MSDKTDSNNPKQDSSRRSDAQQGREQQGSMKQQESGSRQGGMNQQGSSAQRGGTQQLQGSQPRQVPGGLSRRPATSMRQMPQGLAGWTGSPFALMRSMVRDMDRFVDDVWFNRPLVPLMEEELGQQGLWLPEIELSRQDGNVMVTADLPGLNRDDINLEVRDGNLIIEGERQQMSEQDQGGVFRSERRYGSFQRVIPLPEGADTANAKARFDNGVLEVTVPVPQEGQGSQKIRVE
jgi:HSP20 family protein